MYNDSLNAISREKILPDPLVLELLGKRMSRRIIMHWRSTRAYRRRRDERMLMVN